MARIPYNFGSAPNDGLGDDLRQAFGKTDANLQDLYSQVEQAQEDIDALEVGGGGGGGGVSDYNDLTNLPDLGTAAFLDVGTAVGDVVQIITGQKLPALDGSLLINVVGVAPGGINTSGVPVDNEFARWTAADTIEGVTLVMSMVTDAGTVATLNHGTSANQILRLNGSAQIPAVDGSLLTGLRQLPVTGTEGHILKVVSGVPAWAAPAAAGGDVTGIASSTTGHGVVFGDTTGKLLASLGAAPLANTVSAFRTTHASTSADGTQGPALGASVGQALAAQTLANVLVSLDAIAAKAEIVLLAVPYVASVFPTINTGDVLVAGTPIGTNVYSVSLAASSGLVQLEDAFLITDSAGEVGFYTYNESWRLMQQGRDYVNREVSWVANELTFNVDDGRSVRTPAPTAASQIMASIWTNLLEGTEDVELAIPQGGTAFDITVEEGVDGLYEVDMPGTGTYTINSMNFYKLGRRGGGVPFIRYEGSSVTTIPLPVFIASSYLAGSTGAVTPPAHQIGDRLVCIAINTAASTAPTVGAGWTDTGATTAISNSPGLRASSKVAVSSSETCTGFTNATVMYCFVFRKAGGTPAIGPLDYFKTSSAGATTMSWGALTLSSVSSLILGVMVAIGGDTGGLRSDLNAETPQINAPNRTYTGVSDIVTTWSSTTTTASGGTGRKLALSIAIQ